MSKPTSMNWLLLKGLVREQRHWLDFPTKMEREIPGTRVHVLDLPGVGLASKEKAPFRLGKTVEHLRERWLPLVAAEAGPWAVFGVSMGGMLALEWAHRFPEDFLAVVSANASAANLSMPYRRMRPPIWWGISRVGLTRDPVQRELQVLSMVTSSRSQDVELARLFAAFQRDKPVRFQTLFRQLIAAGTWRAPSKLKAKSLILLSEGDRFVHPSCSRALALRLGAELRTHPGAGHEITMDEPEWVLRTLADVFRLAPLVPR